MSAELQARPQRTITVDGTPFTSRWNAVFNTIQYHWTRKDQALFNTTHIGAGVINVLISGDVTTDFQVGDTIYIRTGNNKYNGVGTIITSVFPVSTRTELTISTAPRPPSGR